MFRKIFRFLLKAMIWFFAISFLLVLLFKFIPVPFTPLMTIRAVENKLDGEDMVCSHDWESLDDISINLQKAVIASEDATFLTHNGFDFVAIEKAMKSNEKGRKLKGGRLERMIAGAMEVVYRDEYPLGNTAAALLLEAGINLRRLQQEG